MRRMELWNWLTPAAACALTLMVLVHGASRRLPPLSTTDNASFFGTLIFNPATSNVQHTFVLSKMDENMEWNIWPHPLPAQMDQRAEPRSSLNFWSVIPTNR